MSGDNIIVYGIDLRSISSHFRHSSSGDYIGVPLSDEIENLGWQEGDYIHLEIHSTPTENGASFIKGVKSSADGRHCMKLQKREDRHPPYILQLPIEYTEFNDRSPLFNYSENDEINVEINLDTSEVRFYKTESYPARYRELTDSDIEPRIMTPIGVGIFEYTVDDRLDLATDYGFPRVKLQITPFDVLNKKFLTHSHKRYIRTCPEKLSTDEGVYGGSDEVYVRELCAGQTLDEWNKLERWLAFGNNVPSVEVDKLELVWSPKGVPPKNDKSNTKYIQEAVGQNDQMLNDQNYQTIYKGYNISDLDVSLPSKGTYYILCWLEKGSSALRIDFDKNRPVVGNNPAKHSYDSQSFINHEFLSDKYQVAVPTPIPYEIMDESISDIPIVLYQ